jgi:hypothetical protein
MIKVKKSNINQSVKHIEGQTINELEVDGYKVWTGLPRRQRPVWAGSLKTPAEAKEEKEFEDEVMRISDTLWDYIGDEIQYVVLEKSKQVQVKPYQRKGKYVIGYHRLDPRDKGIVAGVPNFLKKKVPEIKSLDLDKGELKFKDGSGGELVLSTSYGELELKVINLEKKGTGYGTKIINALMDYADSKRVGIVISKAYNKPFWKKFGFREVNLADTLRYEPKIRKLGEPISSKNIGIIGTHHKVEGRQTLASLEIHKEFMDKYILEGMNKEEASKKALDDVRSPEGQKKIKAKIKEIKMSYKKLGEPFKAEPDYWGEPDTNKFLRALYKDTRSIEYLRQEGKQIAEDYRGFIATAEYSTHGDVTELTGEYVKPDDLFMEELEDYNKKFQNEYKKSKVIYRGISAGNIDYAVMDILAGKPLSGDQSEGTMYMTIHPAMAGIFIGDVGEGYVYVLDKEKAEKNGQARPVHYEPVVEWSPEKDYEWEHGKAYTAALADEMEVRSDPIKNPKEVVKEIWIIGPNANKRMDKAQRLYPQFKWRIIPYDELDSLRE